MNPNDKDAFAKAWEALDKPEEIRNAVDQDAVKELKKDDKGRWYWLEGGEMKGAES